MTRFFSNLPILAVALSAGLAACSEDREVDQSAEAIHERVFAFDSEVDTPHLITGGTINPCGATELQVDVPKMRAGGLDGAAFVIWVQQTERSPEAYEAAHAEGMRQLDAFRDVANNLCPDQISIAERTADIERIRQDGKLVALMGMVNGFPLGPNLERLQEYYDKGVRYISFTHLGHNDLADSARPSAELGDSPSEHNGLSDLGRQLVDEMNRLGMIVDASQVNMKTLEDMAARSKAPIIASHSSVFSLVPNPRNITDEGLLAIKNTGGVVQIVAFSGYLVDNQALFFQKLGTLNAQFGLSPGQTAGDLSPEDRQAYDMELGKVFASMPNANVSEFVDHIDYAVTLLGIDHVGISSDFEHGGGVTGWMDASETLNVTKELLARGYTEDEIAKLWGGNFLRVLNAVEQIAAELK